MAETKKTTKPAAKPAAKKETKPVAKPAAKPTPKKEEKVVKEEPSHVYHVSLRKEDKQWQVKNAGSDKVLKLFATQAEAIAYAEKLAKSQDGSVVIHKVEGKIRKQDYSKK